MIISDDKFHHMIEHVAHNLSIYRRLDRVKEMVLQLVSVSNPLEMGMDWRNATCYWISQILDGEISLNQIEANSYWRLEEIWLREIKEIKAYYNWERKWKEHGLGLWSSVNEQEKNYLEACNQIRRMLIDPKIKSSLDNFASIEEYIKFKYLNKEDKIDENKNGMINLINIKANRIRELNKDISIDNSKLSARDYVKLFYDNIIPASREKNLENILGVLKAFQYSKAPENRWIIINCFEVAVAIYFLDKDIIEKIWQDSKEKLVPELVRVCTVPVKDWSPTFEIPKDCKDSFKYDETELKIIFSGLMTEKQKDALLKMVKKESHIAAIKALFEKSRLIHEETTL